MANDPFALADPQKTATDPFALIDDKASPPASVPEPEPGPFGMGVRQSMAGIRSAGGGLAAMVGRGFGVKGIEDYGHDVVARNEAESAANTMRVEDMNSVGGVFDFAKYALGNLLPYALTSAVLGVGGRTAATMASRNVAQEATRAFIKSAGTIAGPAAFNIGIEAGSIFPDAEKMKVENPIARSIMGGVVAGSLDTALPAYLMGKVFGPAARGAGRSYGVKAMLEGAGKEALKSGAIEAGTEGAQTFIERLAAGQPLNDAEATSSYLNSMAVGAVGGHVAGGAVGAYEHRGSAPVVTPAANDPFASVPATPPMANPVTPASNEAVAPGGVAAAGVANSQQPSTSTAVSQQPYPSLTMAKSEFPEIQAMPDLAPATLYGRIEELKGKTDAVASRVASLQAESESSKRTPGRTKQMIRAELGKAQFEQQALTQRLSNLNALAATSDYQTKSGSVDNGVLVAAHEIAPQSIVTPGKSGVITVTGAKPGFMNSATDLVEQNKIKARAAELELPVTPRRTRESIKAPDLKAQQDAFLERAGKVAESNVDALVRGGIVAPEAKTSTRTVIYKAVKSALQESNVDAAKETIRAGIEKAVSRKLLKQDVDSFVDKVFADLAGDQSVKESAAASPATKTEVPSASQVSSDQVQPAQAGGVPVAGENGSSENLQQPAQAQPGAGNGQVQVAPPAAAAVERPAVLTLGKVGVTPLHADPIAIRANPTTGGYDLYQGGYPVQDFNTAENITYPPEMTTPQILADVKSRQKDLFGNRMRFYEEKGKSFNSESAVQEHLRDVVGREQTQFAGAGRAIVEALSRILGPQNRLAVRTYEASANEPAGRTTLRPEKDIIAVATNAKDVLSAAYHEGFHYIEERLLSGGERNTLNRGLAPGTKLFEQVLARAKAYDYENKTDIASEIQAKPEEAHAYGFEMWKRGELQVKGTLQKIFAKIREAIDRIGSAMRGTGFASVLDIYRAIDAGEYASRTAMDRTTDKMGVFNSSALIDSAGRFTDPKLDVIVGKLGDTEQARAHAAFDALDSAQALHTKMAGDTSDQAKALGAAIERADRALSPGSLKASLADRGTSGSEALAVTTELNQRIAEIQGPSRMFESNAAVVDMAQLMADGQLQPQQLMAESSRFFDGIDLPKPTVKQVFGVSKEAIGGSFKRFYLENIASGTFIARDSRGFGNVFAALTGHKQRKDFLIAQGVDVMLSKWDARRGATQEDVATVGQALFKRTEGSFSKSSVEYQQIISTLTPHQREMLEQANAMVADRLQQEFVADQKTMQGLLGQGTPQYAEWFENRQSKVSQLVDQGYMPERRYGDHVVHITVTIKDAAGNPKPLTMLREQFETEAEAKMRLAQYQQALEGDTAFQPAYEYKYAAQHDGSLSYQQFLDMARRQGIDLTQAERERLARAMVSSDSARNNRIFRRSNTPGYSKDSYRVLSEFAVTMANKIAYGEFSDAINSASQGNEVQVAVKQGMPQIAINRDTNLWAGDGPMAGFYRDLSDKRIDFVMQRDPGGDWSRNARAAASMYFLGGSISAGMVQLSSLPMNTVPYLYQHTGYGNAFAKVTGAFKDVTSHFNTLRDIARLKDTQNAMQSIDSITGLRQALIEAAQDGTVLDTEIYHIMGTTRGGMLSKSPRVQKAMDLWMAPFRMAEQVNRYSTFIAAYKVGLENNLSGQQLYTFAQESVYNTQFRYDEANRPGLAHNPVWAILFTFKSYPIFMGELITTLFRQSPRAGVAMLVSLAAASGINGLPFAEDLMDLVDTISQRLFGSPFNSKRAIRNMLKSASEAVTGADMSGLMMNGMVNEMTGMSFASRVGLGNMIPGTRALTADADYKRTAEEIIGPVASMVGGAVEGAVQLSRGNPLEAARKALPLAGQNMVKAYEQFTHGYATDSAGKKLVDTNSWDALAQSVGFSSAKLNQAYDLDRIDRQTQAFYKEMQKDFTNNIVRAVQSRDFAKVNETIQATHAWNQAHPEMPMVLSGPTLRRSIAEAGMPLNERTLKMLPKALRSQSVAMELYGGK